MYGFCITGSAWIGLNCFLPRNIAHSSPLDSISLEPQFNFYIIGENIENIQNGGGEVYFYFDVSDLLFKQNFSIFYVKIVNIQMHKLKLVIKRVNCKDGNARFTIYP